jgi:hypothetical protein
VPQAQASTSCVGPPLEARPRCMTPIPRPSARASNHLSCPLVPRRFGGSRGARCLCLGSSRPEAVRHALRGSFGPRAPMPAHAIGEALSTSREQPTPRRVELPRREKRIKRDSGIRSSLKRLLENARAITPTDDSPRSGRVLVEELLIAWPLGHNQGGFGGKGPSDRSRSPRGESPSRLARFGKYDTKVAPFPRAALPLLSCGAGSP